MSSFFRRGVSSDSAGKGSTEWCHEKAIECMCCLWKGNISSLSLMLTDLNDSHVTRCSVLTASALRAEWTDRGQGYVPRYLGTPAAESPGWHGGLLLVRTLAWMHTFPPNRCRKRPCHGNGRETPPWGPNAPYAMRSALLPRSCPLPRPPERPSRPRRFQVSLSAPAFPVLPSSRPPPNHLHLAPAPLCIHPSTNPRSHHP